MHPYILYVIILLSVIMNILHNRHIVITTITAANVSFSTNIAIVEDQNSWMVYIIKHMQVGVSKVKKTHEYLIWHPQKTRVIWWKTSATKQLFSYWFKHNFSGSTVKLLNIQLNVWKSFRQRSEPVISSNKSYHHFKKGVSSLCAHRTVHLISPEWVHMWQDDTTQEWHSFVSPPLQPLLPKATIW